MLLQLIPNVSGACCLPTQISLSPFYPNSRSHYLSKLKSGHSLNSFQKSFPEHFISPNRRYPFRTVFQEQAIPNFDNYDIDSCGCSECNEATFEVYVQKHPWHTGPRAFLCRFFPRYGNYCGPNFSSGRDNGSSSWELKPVDCLDYCCYKHDVGYDSRDQYELLRADIKFLNCLKSILKDDEIELGYAAKAYANFCILGLRTILIPYRKYFLKSSKKKYFQNKKVLDEAQSFEPNISKTNKKIVD